MEEKFIFHDYESFVNKMFEEDFELGREMLEESIHEYKENGDEKDINLILLNLRRIIKSQENLKVFEALNLNESQINNAISEINYDRNVINKMLEVLDIKERIWKDVAKIRQLRRRDPKRQTSWQRKNELCRWDY